MNPNFQRLMNEATRLTRSGDLAAATAAIQAALGTNGGAPGGSDHSWSASTSGIDIAGLLQPPRQPLHVPEWQPTVEPVNEGPLQGTFRKSSFQSGRAARAYKLYVPPRAGERPLPLVVMLHGCTQTPDDFAAGTGMNDAAAVEGCFVLYPEQSTRFNPQRCWNWFKHNHQERGRGEPALLAAMTRHVMQEHGIDPARVYVAGLSAGGAMAAILGAAYPDLYAAVGVHSGLPAGVAKDLPSALAAMRSGGGANLDAAVGGLPTIVFHGDADQTVHPGNGDDVISACAGADGHRPEIDRAHAAGGRRYTRRVHRRGTAGAVVAEHWVVHGSGHAWSGGRTTGSYTDPQGPDATAEMLRFFREHPRA